MSIFHHSSLHYYSYNIRAFTIDFSAVYLTVYNSAHVTVQVLVLRRSLCTCAPSQAIIGKCHEIQINV